LRAKKIRLLSFHSGVGTSRFHSKYRAKGPTRRRMKLAAFNTSMAFIREQT
jgi:hypothetical protein